MADFVTITETPGQWATNEQLSMMTTRYGLAEKFAENKDVLEIGCGTGIGLGWLATSARLVIGGDIDLANLEVAKKSYKSRPNIQIQQMNACELAVENESLDTIVIFEAIYYLDNVSSFIEEAWRSLRPGGTLLISTVNKEWHGFNPSPFSCEYLSARQISELLVRSGFECQIFNAFYDKPNSLKSWAIGKTRKIAISFNLIPKSMEGKKFLKRIFYGPLSPITCELLPEMAQTEPLHPVELNREIVDYKILYAVGKKTEKKGKTLWT